MNIRNIATILLLISIIMILTSCNVSTSLGTGNTATNISIGNGTVLYKNGWLYYSSIHGLYRTNDDFKTLHKILNVPAYSINVLNDWIYYLEPKSDSTQTRDMITFIYGDRKQNEMKKIRGDGTEEQSLGIENIAKMLVVDEWIYYLPWDTYQLYRIRLDGSEKSLVINERTTLPVFDKGKMYCAIRGNQPGIFKMEMDGTIVQQLNDVHTFAYDIYEGCLYYSKMDESYKLYRLDLNSMQEEAFGDINTSSFIIQDGYLYYVAYQGSDVDDAGVYRYNLSTNEEEVLWSERTEMFNIAGEWVYLRDNDFELPLVYEIPFRLRLDGSGMMLTP